MRKVILMAMVGCICWLSGCAGDLKAECHEFNESVRSDISDAAEAYQSGDEAKLDTAISVIARNIRTAIIFGCECSD